MTREERIAERAVRLEREKRVRERVCAELGWITYPELAK